MTVSTSTARIHYAGDGESTVFAVPFPFFAADDLVVVSRNAASGAESVLARGDDYTVAGGGGAAGSVTALAAPGAGSEWHILRATPDTQTADYRDHDAFPAALHEAALDRAALRSAELRDALGRTLRFPRTDPAAIGAEIPPAPVRAAHLLGFDGSGAPALYDAGLAALPASAGALVGTNAAGTALEEKTGVTSDGAGLAVGGDAVVTETAVQTLANKTLASPVIATPALSGSGGALTLPAGPGALVTQEAGTFTPTLGATVTDGTHTYAAQTGRYVRIGSLVWFNIEMLMSAKDAAITGDVLLRGLPFRASPAAGIVAYSIGPISNLDIDTGGAYSQFIAIVVGNTYDVRIQQIGDAIGNDALDQSAVGHSTAFYVSGTYETDE